MKIVILVGTRPELIKMAPVMRALDRRNVEYLFVHSNQHYSESLDKTIITDLEIREPDANLHVGSGTHGQQTARILETFESFCLEARPDIVLVHGDTNTALAGALVASKLHIRIGHIEAGLRSFDMQMPEEVNRVLIDHVSTFLFAPTQDTKQNLLNEGISEDKIFVTGNTIVDAMKEHSSFLEKAHTHQKIQDTDYILVTAHRPENVDTLENLQELIDLLTAAQETLKIPIVFPAHPRTKNKIKEFAIQIPETIHVIEPVGYIDMLSLLQNARLVLTDSGGLQEEVFIMRKPLMTLRDTTERPETLTANFLIHRDIGKFHDAYEKIIRGDIHWHDNFGDGTASEKIVNILI